MEYEGAVTWVGPGAELGREGGDSLIKGIMQCNIASSRGKKQRVSLGIISFFINNS